MLQRLALANLLLLLALLAGCAPVPAALPAAAPTPSVAATTITFSSYANEEAAYAPLIAAFNQQNPDLRVQWLSRPPAEGGDATDRLRQLLGAADTVVLEALTLPSALEARLLLDMAPLRDVDTGFAPNDLFPAARVGGPAGSGFFLLPRSLSVPLAHYNPQPWQQRGLSPPPSDGSWPTLFAALTEVANVRDIQRPGYGWLDRSNGLLPLLAVLAQNGVDPTTPLDDPRMLAALEQLAALRQQGAWHPASQVSDAAGVVISGRAALWDEALQTDLPAGAALPFTPGTLLLPPLPAASLVGDGYGISAGTQHPEAAWRWLSFLSRQQPVASAAGSLPIRPSLADAANLWQRFDGATQTALRQRLAAAPDAEQLSQTQLLAMQTVLRAIFQEGQTPAAAAQAVQAQQAAATVIPDRPDADAPLAVEPRPPAPTATRAVTIRFGWPDDDPVMQQLARAFMDAQPQIGVVIGLGSLAQRERYTMADLAQTSDCFSWGAPLRAEAFRQVARLQPFLDADPQLQLGDIPPVLRRPFEQQGELYALPQQLQVRMLAYDPALFVAANLPPPNASWTVEDFLRSAVALTEGEGNARRYGFVEASGFSAQRLDGFLRLQNVAPFGEADQGPIAFSDPAVLEAVRQYLALVQQASPATTFSGYTPRAGDLILVNRLLLEGRVGMWYTFELPSAFDVDAMQMRELPAQLATPPQLARTLSRADLRLSGLYISAASQHQEACWTWLRFLHREQLRWIGADTLPANRTVATSAEFLDALRPDLAAVYRSYNDVLAQADPNLLAPPRPGAPVVDPFWFYRAVDRAFQGGDLTTELADAQFLTEQRLACVRGGEGSGACARQVDPSMRALARSRSYA